MYPTPKLPLRLTTPLVLVLVALSAFLIAFRIEQVLLDFAQARSLRAANQVREQIEAGFRFGLGLTDQAALPGRLQRQAAMDGTLAAVRVQSEQGEVVAQAGNAAAFTALNPVWSQQLLAQGAYAGAAVQSVARHAGATSYVGVPAVDASGRPVAVVWLVHDRRELRQAAWSVLSGLAPWAVVAGAVLVFALGALAAQWMRSAHARLAAAQRALDPAGPDAPERRPADVVALVDGAGGAGRDLLLLLVAFALTFGVLAGLAWKARELARPMLLAQVDESARTVLQQAHGHIARALALGIPAGELVGVEAMFASELQPAREIAFLALQREAGQRTAFTPGTATDDPLARAAQAWLAGQAPGAQFRIAIQPLEAGGQAIGRLVTGTPLSYVDERLRSILMDLLFAVVVSLVLVREVLGGLWQRSALRPYVVFSAAWRHWRAQAARLGAGVATAQWLDWMTGARNAVARIADEAGRQVRRVALAGVGREFVRLRLIVFFTALSDELLRPFFAVFASEARPLGVDLSPTMLAALPVAAFMVTLTLAQPLGPWITRRVEVRRALLVVAALGAALVAATAFARDSATLVLLRAGSGAAYGLMLILAQTTVLRITDFSNRARGLVEVSAAIVAAGVCGPPLGGLLVERLGTGAAFAACAACLAAAAAVCMTLAPLPRDHRGNLAGSGGWRGIAAVLRHRRVMAVTWLAAVPARLAAAALLVVVTPLYVLEVGETSAVAGRIQLLYFLVFMTSAPWVARWSDMRRTRKPWILWGCGLSALACAAPPLVGGVAGMALCCGLLGFAQALLSAPQLALVTEAFDADPDATQVVGATPEQALAAFRFIERAGSILAPIAVALAVGRFGLAGAVGAIGALLAAAGLALALCLLQPSTPSTDRRHVQA